MIFRFEMLVFGNVDLLQTIGLPHLLLNKLNNERAQFIVVGLVFIIVVSLSTIDLLDDSEELFVGCIH